MMRRSLAEQIPGSENYRCSGQNTQWNQRSGGSLPKKEWSSLRERSSCSAGLLRTRFFVGARLWETGTQESLVPRFWYSQCHHTEFMWSGSENKQHCSENVWSGCTLCFVTVKESYMFTRNNKLVGLRNRFGTNDYERLPKIMRFWNGWSTPAIIHSKQNCGQMNPKPEGHWAKQRRLKEERAARMRSVAEQNSGVWWNASVFF